jgi:hypothetical protein
MSQLVLDDQLDVQVILPELPRGLTALRLQSLRPGELILDDRVPELLLDLKQPTFITIDRGFWHRRLCHSQYCLLYIALAKDEQEQLPGLLRRLFRLPEFRTRSARMGKVARVQKHRVTFWYLGNRESLQLPQA